MTVREAFERAYGLVPSGSFHIGCQETEHPDSLDPTPTVVQDTPDDPNDDVTWWLWKWARWVSARGEGIFDMPLEYGPDIADRPAEAFLGFFGEDYDRVVQEGAK